MVRLTSECPVGHRTVWRRRGAKEVNESFNGFYLWIRFENMLYVLSHGPGTAQDAILWVRGREGALDTIDSEAQTAAVITSSILSQITEKTAFYPISATLLLAY